MNEARNAIDLIIHAPEKVAEGYLSSLLASKAIEQFENIYALSINRAARFNSVSVTIGQYRLYEDFFLKLEDP